MNFKQLLNLLAAVTLPMASAAGVIGVFSSDAKTNESVRNYMARSNDLMIRNSARAVNCFDQYIKSIDQIAKAYQQNHDSCIQASRQGYTQAEAATIDNRNALASSAEESCDLLIRCSGIESAEKVFQCYIAGSSTNGKTMYRINANAAEHLSDLQEEFRLIQNREYKCTNDTKRAYEKDSFEAYDKFNKCNLGISAGLDPTEPPTETEPTEEPENPEVTETPEITEAPVETEPTEEPENPEVTEAPVETEPTEEPDVPENTENPEVTEASVETEPTKEPENPEVTEAPVETEPTKEPEVPENTENPEVTEVPVETVPTEGPENPEVTEAPVETEPTKEPEIPANTEAPVETDPSAEPENPENPEATDDPEIPESPESTESAESTQSPESTESAANKSKANLPGGGLSLSQRILSRFKKLRL